jgi:Tfp pilus assembly protein PilF
LRHPTLDSTLAKVYIGDEVLLIEGKLILVFLRNIYSIPDEEEFLFDLNACFRLEPIRQDGSVQLIKMIASNERQIITKDYIEEAQRATEEKSVVVVFGRLMCNLGQHDKSQKYFEQLLNDSNDEDIAWIELNIGRALHFKGEWKQAREYYDRAYHLLMKNKPARIKDSAQVLNNIGNILRQQGQYDEALDYHHRALKMREKYYPSGHITIGNSLNNIGVVYKHQHKPMMALDYYQRALIIK